MIRCTCSCGRVYDDIPDNLAGRTIICRACKAKLVLVAVTPTAEPGPTEPEVALTGFKGWYSRRNDVEQAGFLGMIAALPILLLLLATHTSTASSPAEVARKPTQIVEALPLVTAIDVGIPYPANTAISVSQAEPAEGGSAAPIAQPDIAFQAEPLANPVSTGPGSHLLTTRQINALWSKPTTGSGYSGGSEPSRNLARTIPRASGNTTYRSSAPASSFVDRSQSNIGHTATGIPLHMGPRGGIFHYSKSGKKVYQKRK